MKYFNNNPSKLIAAMKHKLPFTDRRAVNSSKQTFIHSTNPLISVKSHKFLRYAISNACDFSSAPARQMHRQSKRRDKQSPVQLHI